MRITPQMIKTIQDLYPNEVVDIIEGRLHDQIHVIGLEKNMETLIGGRLNADPTKAGCIGMTRVHYLHMSTGDLRV